MSVYDLEKAVAEAKDDKITALLEKRGIRVLRFRYHAPLSKKLLDDIVTQIGEALKRA